MILIVFFWVVLKQKPSETLPIQAEETFAEEENVPPPVLEPLVEEKSLDLAISFQQDIFKCSKVFKKSG